MIQRLHLSLLIVLGLVTGALAVQAIAMIGAAHADPIAVDAGQVTPAVIEAGTAPAAPAVAPQPAIHDPVAAPGAAFDELKAARRIGWAAAVLVGLTMLLLALPHLGIKWLAEGTRAFVLAIATTGCLAAGNAALDGGSWYAVLMAGAVAAAGLWQSNRTHAAAMKAAKEGVV